MIIRLQCTDSVGLVAAISGIMAAENLNIISMREFVNRDLNRFYMRLAVDRELPESKLRKKLAAVLPADAQINISGKHSKKIVVFVTREFHCLGEILLQHFFETLGAQLECVVGNHNTLETLCKRFDVPFHFISHEGISKQDFESRVEEILTGVQFDYIVLAKFMRILSPQFVEKFNNRILNIHHSFLPAFVGANPYRQAHVRGVKMIGATAHFVTNDLDEGPIIAQQIIPVNHAYTVKDMVEAGKEIEKSVLIRALHLVINDRVMVSGNKTIVFE